MEEGRVEPEVVTLTLPCEERFIAVARIVVGGLAARLDLSYESLDDLQLAVEAVLSECASRPGDEVTVELTVLERHVQVRIGPVDPGTAVAALGVLEADDVGLGVLLGAVMDEVALEDGADGRWLRLDKRASVLPRS